MKRNNDDLEEYGKELRNIKTDSDFEWASVADAQPTDIGLQITWELASGREFVQEYETPEEWTSLSSRLVRLLEFWDLDPTDIDLLNDSDLTHEIPARYDVGEEAWRPDWNAIERSNGGSGDGD